MHEGKRAYSRGGHQASAPYAPFLLLLDERPSEEAALPILEAAQLLGFPTHADYILKIRMAKCTLPQCLPGILLCGSLAYDLQYPAVQNVLEFENGLKDKLIPFGLKEKEKLLKLKEEEKKELGHSFDGEINAWDFRYPYFSFLTTHSSFFAHLAAVMTVGITIACCSRRSTKSTMTRSRSTSLLKS